MARYVRQAAVLLELEAVYGTDIVPTPGADALLVKDLTYPEFVANNVDRDNIKPYFGNNEQLVGTRHQTCGFKVELAGSGAAGTAPPWGKSLLACAFAEDVQAAYVAYTPITDAIKSATIYWYDSGVFHKFTGTMGNPKLSVKVGEIPYIEFTMTGLYNTLTAAALPAITLSAWTKPLVASKVNTGSLTFGGTYAAGVVTGGTGYCSTGLEVDMGNQVDFTAMIGCERVDVSDRKANANFMLELTAAEEVAAMAIVENNTLANVSIEHGTVAGNIVLISMPKVQRINPRKDDLNGLRMISYEGIVTPNTGNDEIVIVAK